MCVLTHHIAGAFADDGEYVLLYIEEGRNPVNRLYYVDLSALKLNNFGGSPFAGFAENAVRLVDNFRAGYTYVANDGNRFVFRTNLHAPNYKLVRVPIVGRCRV